ncbi:MAG: GNAT family N-acetyltransferase [Bacilli bacterium]|nr:GNAT family N-acetyltransferase [Bacilli bacterium]
MISNLTIDQLKNINLLLKENNQEILKEEDLDEKSFNHYIVYKDDKKIKGFLNYALIYDRIEINYIVVNINYRNQKIASNLMKYLISIAYEYDCLNISLEVNKNNQSALKLYKKYGFKEVGIRKNYYNGVDAILMIRELIK